MALFALKVSSSHEIRILQAFWELALSRLSSRNHCLPFLLLPCSQKRQGSSQATSLPLSILVFLFGFFSSQCPSVSSRIVLELGRAKTNPIIQPLLPCWKTSSFQG